MDTTAIDWGFIVAGFVIAWIVIRILKNIVIEILFFGIAWTLIFDNHYVFSKFLGTPEPSLFFMKLAAGVFLAWTIYRVLYIVAHQWVPQMKPIMKKVFGKNTNLFKGK